MVLTNLDPPTRGPLQVGDLHDVLSYHVVVVFLLLSWRVVSGHQDGRLVGERGPVLAGRDKISTDMEGHHLSPDERYAAANSARRHLPWADWDVESVFGAESPSLSDEGWKTIRGAMVMPLMIQGYKKGLIKFTIITSRKPGAA
jgi:hypothetical protein